MKKTIVLLLTISAFACSYARDKALEYISPADVSIEDVFFTRFGNLIYNVDSGIKGKRVACDRKIKAAKWDKEYKSLSLWGATENHNALEAYNAAVRLFLANPKSEYADIAERALYNGVLAELDSSKAGSEMWRKAAQAVMSAPATAYATRGADLWINLYYRNTAYVKNDSLDMVILQNTSAPWQANVFFSMKFNRPKTHMRLHLRLPAWLRNEVTPAGNYAFEPTREFYQVIVNGKMLSVRASEDGYITLDRIWETNDVIRFSMRTPVRRIRAKGGGEKAFAVQEGPIVYAYESRGEKKYFDSKAAFGNNYDKDVLHTNSLATKVYTSPKRGDETPWEGFLLPYYISFGRNTFQPQLWLKEIE